MNYDFTASELALRVTLGRLIEDLVVPDIGAAGGADETKLMDRLVADDWLELLTEPADGWAPEDFTAAVHAFEQFGALPIATAVPTVVSFVWPLLRYLDMPDSVREEVRARLTCGGLLATPVPSQIGSDGRFDFEQPAPIDETTTVLLAFGILAGDRAGSALCAVHSSDGRRGLWMGRVAADSTVQVRGMALCCGVVDVVLGPVHSPGDGLLGDLVPEDVFLAAVQPAMMHHLIGLGAQAVGGSEAVLRRTVRYVSEREQFGQPVAGFQAVRHRVADMYTRVENSRAVLFEAAWRLATRAPDAQVWVHAARAYTAESYLAVCEAGIQCHGGIGFTWEADLHRWYRHAIATSTYLADVRLTRRALAHEILMAPGPAAAQADAS